jgi:hypothetical protein
MNSDTGNSKTWRKGLDRLVDEVVADMPEQKRREIKELAGKTSSAAALEAFGMKKPLVDDREIGRLRFRGRREHDKCRIDYETGEISCTNHPLHGKKPPRDRYDYLDCRQRWCPWFTGMDRERKRRARRHAESEGRDDAISLYNLDTVE